MTIYRVFDDKENNRLQFTIPGGYMWVTDPVEVEAIRTEIVWAENNLPKNKFLPFVEFTMNEETYKENIPV